MEYMEAEFGTGRFPMEYCEAEVGTQPFSLQDLQDEADQDLPETEYEEAEDGTGHDLE